MLASQPRSAVSASMERALGGSPDLLKEYKTPLGDPGLFGPGSPVWQVHADLPAMLIGGIASLMFQTLHPLAMIGVAEHSNYRDDPFGRLKRTARFVGGTTYGSRPFVEQLVGEVKRVHTRVRGVAPDGRPYEAGDPALLTWVHTVEVWCFLRAYQRYSNRPLLRVEKDRYLDEMSEVAVLLGARDVPRSVNEVRTYLREVRRELVVTPQALEAVRFLRATPLSGPKPAEVIAHRIVSNAAIEELPSYARRELGLPRPGPISRAHARAAAATFGVVLRWAIGPSAVLATATDRALAG
jgi:uncharacterized protein (DUF2236 family)